MLAVVGVWGVVVREVVALVVAVRGVVLWWVLVLLLLGVWLVWLSFFVVGVWVCWVVFKVFFFAFPLWFLAVRCLEGELVAPFVRFADDLVKVFCGEFLLGGGCCVCVPA